MAPPPPRPPQRTQAVRASIAAFLGLLALYFSYQALNGNSFSSSGERSIDLISACPQQPNSSLHHLYATEPRLALSIFTLEHDAVSLEVQDHSNRDFTLGHRLTHEFYGGALCAASSASGITSPHGSCQGLVLDVGAFIGTHALLLARLGYTVHAFEPQAHAVDLLRCSAASNGLNITATAEGVSDAVGKECFINPMVAAAHQAMTAPKLLSRLGCEASSQVQVVTLDHYWKNVLNKQQVLFIKVDTEGHEGYVLDGAAELLSSAPPPFLLLEYYPHMLALKNVTPTSLLDKAYAYGYRVYDCTKRIEVVPGPEGEKVLKPYALSFSLTDLLLVHKSTAPQDMKAKYECAY